MRIFDQVQEMILLIPHAFYLGVQSLSRAQLLATPWTAAHQASLSFTISRSLFKLVSIESAVLSGRVILNHPFCHLLPIFPNFRFFSNESALCIKWPKYWSFNLSISPSNEYSGLISLRIDWFDLSLSKGLSRVISSTTVQKHQFFSTQPSL